MIRATLQSDGTWQVDSGRGSESFTFQSVIFVFDNAQLTDMGGGTAVIEVS